MAQVPVTDGPNVGLNPAPTPFQQVNAPAAAFGANVGGEGLSEVGSAAQSASDVLQQRALAVQDLNNKSAADVSYSRAIPAMSDIQSDFTTNVKGADATSALPQYQAKLLDAMSAGGEGLTPIAKSYYDQETRRVYAAGVASLKTYADGQYHDYVTKSSAMKDDAGWAAYTANPTDASLNAAVATTMDESSFRAHMELGANASPDLIHQTQVETVSKQFSNVLKGLAGSDPGTAYTLALQNKDLLYGQDAAILGTLRHGATTAWAASDALGLVDHAVSVAGSAVNADTLWAAVKTQESSNRPGVLGPMTASGQAEGLTQLLPQTAQEMAVKLGVPWQPALMRGTTPEATAYQEKLGRAYFDQGLAATGGDQAKALEYYYGGPDPSQWGPKTQAYAQTVLANAGGATNSVTLKAQLSAVQEQATTLANQRFPDSIGPAAPMYRAEYIEQLSHTADSVLGQRVQAMRDQEQETVSSVLNQAISNHWNGPQDMPASAISAMSALPASERTAVTNLMDSNARQWTPERAANFGTAQGLYAARTKLGENNNFENLPLSAFGDVSTSQAAQIMKWQADAKTEVQQGANDQSVLKKITQLPEYASAAASAGGTVPSKLNQFTGALDMEIENFKGQNNGREPNPVEQSKILNSVTARSVTVPGGLFSAPSTASVPFAVPTDEVQPIKDALTHAGLPTDDYHVGKLYQSMQLKQAGRLAPGVQVAY